MLFKATLITFAIISALTFLIYAWDKAAAKLKTRRIPERVLLTLSLLGGGVGGMLSMYAFRHKTRHIYFTVLNILGIIWQAGLLIFLYAKGL